jgi:hypothetical protein
LARLNANTVGEIDVIAEFRGEKREGINERPSNG